MIYLKIFEEYNDFVIDDIINNIKDITMEISDDGYDIDVESESNQFIIVSFYGKEIDGSTSGDRDYETFKSDIFKESDLRIKDYLGDKLKSSHYKYDIDYSPALVRSEYFPSINTNQLYCKYELY